MSDDLKVRDLLLEAVAEEQRDQGMMPTVADNSRYIETVLNNLDRRERERVVSQASRPTATKKDGAFQKEVERRCRRHGIEPVGGYTVTRSESLLGDAPVFVDKVMGTAEKRLRARLRLIRSRPEWADKLKRINPLVLQGQFGEEKRLEAVNEVRKVLHEADIAWGEWWRPPPASPLWFSGKGTTDAE